jgi:predicted nucleic acid-binding protein
VTRTKIVVDTDILSMFAKAGAMPVLGAFLGQGRLVMTPAIYDEITAPLQYGYTYPMAVLAQVPVEPLTAQIWQEYERLWGLRSALGKGELQAIAFCKVEGTLFATNDGVARRFAREQGVQVLTLQAILRGLWLSGSRSKDEVRVLLECIKEADALEVPPEVEREIFGESDADDPTLSEPDEGGL